MTSSSSQPKNARRSETATTTVASSPSSSSASSSSSSSSSSDPSSWAFLPTFVPAFLYLVLTRTYFAPPDSFSHSFVRTYRPVSTSVHVDVGPGGGRQRSLESILDRLSSIVSIPKDLPPIGEDGGGRPSGLIKRGAALPLLRPLELVLGEGETGVGSLNDDDGDGRRRGGGGDGSGVFRSLVDALWVHDSELGRGYLLLSDSGSSGRIWRWEVGGGPITIGRSLQMERSGCRSNRTRVCIDGDGDDDGGSSALPSSSPFAGSGGLAVEFRSGSESCREGKLLVAEWGERRIVRVEESGSRTPLVANVPALCSTGDGTTMARLDRPGQMLYTPFGDLVFVENTFISGRKNGSANGSCTDADSNHDTRSNVERTAGVYRLKEAIHVPELPVSKSRSAHSWNATNQDENVELLYRDNAERIGGIALDGNYTGLFVSVSRGGRLLLVHLSLDDEDDDDDEEDDDEEEGDGTATAVEDETEAKEDAIAKKKAGGAAMGGPSLEERQTANVLRRGVLDGTIKSKIFYDLSAHAPPSGPPTNVPSSPSSLDDDDDHPRPGGVAVDDSGNVYVGHPLGLVLLSPGGEHLGTIAFDDSENDVVADVSSTATEEEGGDRDGDGRPTSDEGRSAAGRRRRRRRRRRSSPTSVAIGGDGYLYLTTERSLYRMKLNRGVKPLEVPTNLLVPRRKTTTTRTTAEDAS